MIVDQQQESLERLSKRQHPDCVVCGVSNPRGLQLDFSVRPDGSVEALFPGQAVYQGYANMLHGGVITSLLDGAMTNCLFAKGITALTAELTIRMLSPVATDGVVRAEAWLEKAATPLYIVKAKLFQEDRAVARATGKFIKARPGGVENDKRRQECSELVVCSTASS